MKDRPRRDAKAIFLAAVENHSPEEWGSYLDEACGTDESLRGLVEALLQAHREKDSVFDDPTIPLHQSLSGFSQISLTDAPDDVSPLAITSSRGTGERSPERVGRYRIEGEIARGGVGAVYKARDDDLGRSLAVKMLLDDHRRSPEMLQRFMEEAQISGQLQHPGIVPVHDVGLFADEKPYFVMKLVKGQTLSRILSAREHSAQERQRFFGVFEQICETIAYAHARGVIHRDLKPSNVMIGSFGEVQVVDWGLAKVLARDAIVDDHPAASRTDRTAIETVRSGSTDSGSLTGSILGTPAYMSPEQARGRIDELDERSDVFGLGAILCEILTGKPPYVAATAGELLSQAKKGNLEGAWARLDASGADGEMIELAKRCSAFEPRDRPRDAGAVVKEVRDYLEALEERARSMQIRAAKARLRMILALAILLFLSLGAGATIWLVEERRERADQATRALAGAISEARELMAAADAGDPADAPAWRRALDATRRADGLLTDEVDGGTRRELEKVTAMIEAGLETSRFRARVEDLRDVPLDLDWEALAELDSGYTIAFQTLLGRDLEAMDVEDGLDLIRASPIARELSYALNEWSVVRYLRSLPTGDWDRLAQEHTRTTLSKLSIGSLPSPTRERWSRFLMTMARLNVNDPEFIDFVRALSTPGLLVFARGVTLRRDYAPAEICLRTALRREPGSYRVNYDLGRLLWERRAFDQAYRYALAARSLGPDRPRAWWSLGTVLEDLRDDDEALEAYTQAALLDPTETRFYEELRELTEREDRPGFGHEALGRAVSSLAELISSDEQVPSEARTALDRLMYDSVDAVLDEPETLIDEGALWRFHASRDGAFPGLEWAAPELDDSAWPEGRSGFGYGDGDDATVLDDMWGNYARVYIRRVLDLPDPARFRRIELALRVDDGCVVYLNGELVARLRVTPEGVVTAAPEPLAAVVFGIPLSKLKKGRNLIAIEGRNQSRASSDFSLLALVRGERAAEAAREHDRERLEEFRTRVSGPHAEARIAYFEGRVLQRAGDHEKAKEKLFETLRADPGSTVTSYALLESLLEAESLDSVAARLRELFVHATPLAPRFWGSGLRTALVDRGWTPAELVALLPPEETRSDWNEIRRYLERLRDREPIRINCGDNEYASASGVVWDGDRFFSGGNRFYGGRVFQDDIRDTDDDRIYATERWFPPPPEPPGAYRVPLPAGDYRVTLHFAEIVPQLGEQRVFDVVIEGKDVLSGYRPAGRAGPAVADVHSFEVRVEDRVLDIEFVHRSNNPKISGIEIREVE